MGRPLAVFPNGGGYVAVITAVLAGSAAGLLAAVASDHSLTAALIPGGAVAVAALAAMMRYQHSVWERSAAVPLSDAYDTEPPRP